MFYWFFYILYIFIKNNNISIEHFHSSKLLPRINKGDEKKIQSYHSPQRANINKHQARPKLSEGLVV